MPVVQQQAAAASAAAAPATSSEFVSHSVPLAPRLGSSEADSPSVSNDDPNKGAFGGTGERNGYCLDAQVTPMPQSDRYFLVHAWVDSASRTPLPDGTEVVFHLHPTFPHPAVSVKSSGGKATIDRLAWGAFTIGVEIEGVRLELDLAQDVAAPRAFRER
jgi:hypothetical protein